MQKLLTSLISQAVQALQQQGELTQPLKAIQIEPTRDKKFGDFASNIAMNLAKTEGKKPRELAEKIIAHLPTHALLKKAEIAGPGFINFYLVEDAFFSSIGDCLAAGNQYGQSKLGADEPILLEYVSSNPTGPLHVGHGRGAAYGASLANILEAVGYKVQREYYVNDAGRQMDIVAVSVWLRYLELMGETLPFPAAGYKGDYVIDIAKQLKIAYGDQFLQPLDEILAELPADSAGNGSAEKEIYIDALIIRTKTLLGSENYQLIFQEALKSILDDIRADLSEFGVNFQNWFHESSLFQTGALERGLAKLRQGEHLYEKEGAVWFRATTFGDEKDRVVIRENGFPTYFASDIAYHLNKFERGFSRAIDIFGSDHHGYAPRVKAFMQAVSIPPEKLLVLLVQFAILYRGKERVQMSTRSGSFVTLRELREEVGNDAARYFYVMRKPEQHLDFDLELAKSQSNENPVYYIQYAHARICSVFRQLEVKNWQFDQTAGLKNLSTLTTAHERDLAKKVAEYPQLLEDAAKHYEPHLLAHYLQELANCFHTYYNAEQFLVEDANLRNARLTLIAASKQVLFNGLILLGVSAPEVM